MTVCVKLAGYSVEVGWSFAYFRQVGWCETAPPSVTLWHNRNSCALLEIIDKPNFPVMHKVGSVDILYYFNFEK